MSILPFGKNRGKALEKCSESYIKWLASHKKVLNPLNWKYADEAQQFLKEKEMEQKQGRISYLDKNCIDVNHYVIALSDDIKVEVSQKFKVGDRVIVTMDNDEVAIKVERVA